MEEEKSVSAEATKSSGSKKKVIITVVVLIILIVGGYFAFKHSSVGNGSSASVATVNGVAIPKSTFETQLASAIASYQSQGVDATSTAALAQIKQQVLSNMIDNELLKEGVTAAGITASSTQVDAQYQALVTQAGGQTQLQAEETQNKMTDAQLRQNIADQLAVQTYLLQNIDVSSITASDAEIAAFYAQYSTSQKASGQTVPALSDLSAQIKQQIISNKEQTLVTNFVAGLRAKATIATSTAL